MDENNYRDKIIELIYKYRDVRFVHNGRSLEEGLDCLGFMVLFYKEFGINIPSGDGEDISLNWFIEDPERYIRGIKQLGGREVELDELQTLDLVYFTIKKNIITHTGIMVNSKEFVHMSPRRGFTIDLMERHWRKFRGAIRIIEK